MSLIKVLTTFFTKSERRNKQMFCDYLPNQIDWDIHHIRLVSVSRLKLTHMSELSRNLHQLAKANQSLALNWVCYERGAYGKVMLYYCVDDSLNDKTIDDTCIRHEINTYLDKYSDALVLWNCLESTTDDGEDDELLDRSIRQIANIIVPPDIKITKLGYQLYDNIRCESTDNAKCDKKVNSVKPRDL